MNLKIDGIIEGAQKIREKVALELPTHSGLAGAVEEVNKAAAEAKSVAQRRRRLFSLSRLPAAFLGLAILALLAWIYWNFFLERKVSVVIPERDSTEVNLRFFRNKSIIRKKAESSKLAIGDVVLGKADVAYIQAGIDVHRDLKVLQTPILEDVLWMVRKDRPADRPISMVITNDQDEGSHRVAIDFFRNWNPEQIPDFKHEWKNVVVASDKRASTYQIEPQVDAVFVVINVADELNQLRIKEFLKAGFQLTSPYIGAQGEKLGYTQEFRMPAGYISQNPEIPDQEILTYRVPNVLVAKREISDATLANLSHLFEPDSKKLQSVDFDFNAKDASELFQGLDAFLGILINIILGFIAVLGLEMWVYRKRFHALNSLVSLLSMLQSNKDILGQTDPDRRSENLQYLSTVSDLLSMISAINGFYTQENSSLLFNNQSEVIHERCDNLKLNIQLKILHAGIQLEPRKPKQDEQSQPSVSDHLAQIGELPIADR